MAATIMTMAENSRIQLQPAACNPILSQNAQPGCPMKVLPVPESLQRAMQGDPLACDVWSSFVSWEAQICPRRLQDRHLGKTGHSICCIHALRELHASRVSLQSTPKCSQKMFSQ